MDASHEDMQLYREHCAGMKEGFAYLVDTGEISRMPTREEMERVKPILLKKIVEGDWSDTTQELVEILCSVSSITSNMHGL